ncbi:MAG: pectinesterase family protein [Eubacteriales bacterium]|nr:pectinesterase family protein [Eubacteriales bacterium]MDD3882832.1 pectinesterase family protein [Eubacteriales bacterium]MDD4513270.1 pectinesterase family protein [Eubacteriales bacterium]
MYVVAKDGSGDFTSLQAAIDAVPEGRDAKTIIVLRMDTYAEKVIINKSNLRIVGESRDRTRITNGDYAKMLLENGEEYETFLSYTVLVAADNVEIENLTIENNAGEGKEIAQAVALYAAGDRFSARNLKITGKQDTLFCGPITEKCAKYAKRPVPPSDIKNAGDCGLTKERQYFEECIIAGSVDFIFGPYRVWFEKCELIAAKSDKAFRGWYTAANTPKEQEYGFVFCRCHLTGECRDGAMSLGRPWRKYARTAFIDCEMDAVVAQRGFLDWDGERQVTWRYQEYGTTGKGASGNERDRRAARLTESERRALTPIAVLSGTDGWNPANRIPTIYLCGDSTMADYPHEKRPMTGWGTALRPLTAGKFHTENCAMCGRSSKSFIAEKRLALIELCLRKGDKLIIQFSHNDEKSDVGVSTSAGGTYPLYLKMFINAARERGAEPIVLTPVARRRFDGNGSFYKSHGEYPDAARKTAAEAGVRLIDMEKLTDNLLMSMGEEKSKSLYLHLEKGTENYEDGLCDDTHLSVRGAAEFARLFAGEFEGHEI